MSGIIRIDMPKGTPEGQTTLSPASPQVSATASPKISGKGALLIGYGVMVGKQAIQIATREIALGGNEELATDISNIVTAVGIGIGAFATGGLSLIPQGISAGATLITRNREMIRENRNRAYELSMRGSRLNYNAGGSYE